MCSKTHQVSQSTTNALPHYSKNILNRPPPPPKWNPRYATDYECQSSGSISIIEFGLRVNSTRYTEHNTEINIECTI